MTILLMILVSRMILSAVKEMTMMATMALKTMMTKQGTMMEMMMMKLMMMTNKLMVTIGLNSQKNWHCLEQIKQIPL